MARHTQASVKTRIEALEKVLELGQGRINPDSIDQARATIDKVSRRTNVSADHTVIGFFGATGSGKSTLFNAVVGQQIAETAVRRPTTAEALAAVWGREGADEVLDWLQVKHRVFLESETLKEVPTGPWAKARNFLTHRDSETRGGLILLDLPDFDSIEMSNRDVVERLIKLVDVLVWVFDPQKYADAVIHQEFIAPMASHSQVMMAVLNQADRVEATEIPVILTSLQRQLGEDGLKQKMLAPAMAVSARTGEGVENLRTLLASVAEKKQASVARIHADLNGVTRILQKQSGGSTRVTEESARQLEDDLYAVVAGDSVVKAAGDSYTMRAASSTGMVATRWLLKFKADPLKRLNLHHSEQELSRSSLPPLNGAQTSAVNAATRAFGRRSAEDMPDPWHTAIRDAAMAQNEELPGALEKALSSVDFGWNKSRWWWSLINLFQWLALLCAVLGLGWLLAYPLAGFFQFYLPPAPVLEGTPLSLPTGLLLFAVLLALLLTLMARLFNKLGRKGYERRMRKQIRQKISATTQKYVIDPTTAEIHRMQTYNQTLDAS